MVLHADSKEFLFAHWCLRHMDSSQWTWLWGALKATWDITHWGAEGNGPATFLEKLCDSRMAPGLLWTAMS